jgi:ubiquinone/menaquinone biosynthesis C-methylase UbiE
MDQKDNVIQAFTEIATKYEQVVDAELRKFWGIGYEDFVSRLTENLAAGKGIRALDVATGTAVIPLSMIQQDKIPGHLVGLDITLPMLQQAKDNVDGAGLRNQVDLTCASAMAMPFQSGSFDLVISALATHHMDVRLAFSEMSRVLASGGSLTIADVGGSASWRNPLIKNLMKFGTFLYFLPGEGFSRAKIEAAALDNIRTAEEWADLLAELSFDQIEVTKIPIRKKWIPGPLFIRAKKI